MSNSDPKLARDSIEPVGPPPGPGYSYGPKGGYQGTGGEISRFVTPGGNPMDFSQPAFPVFHRKFADPTAIGLYSFALPSFLLNLYNVQARGVTVPNFILGVALGYGGLGLFVAGLMEWASGNTFAATTFTTYGSFWLAFGINLVPQFEVIKSYPTPEMYEDALGMFLCCYGAITFLFGVAALRSSVGLVLVFITLDCHFWILGAGYLAHSETTIKVGGGFGLLTAACGAYVATSTLHTKDSSYFLLPIGDLSPKR
ncbi:hypothetical protein IAT38_004410 [Cryptococcus sp. DSM 104549]